MTGPTTDLAGRADGERPDRVAALGAEPAPPGGAAPTEPQGKPTRRVPVRWLVAFAIAVFGFVGAAMGAFETCRQELVPTGGQEVRDGQVVTTGPELVEVCGPPSSPTSR